MLTALNKALRKSRPAYSASRRPIFLAAVLGLCLIIFILNLHDAVPVRIEDPERRADRTSDHTDIFHHWIGRDKCGFGSMDLHLPSDLLCDNPTDMLQSMSDGGRGGFDAPYIPRGCDIKFYTSQEICSILSRYERVIIYGDSLMRHLTSAFAMLLRENMEFGGQQQWKLTQADNTTCRCDEQTKLLGCHESDVRSLSQIYENDASSIYCNFMERPQVDFQNMQKWPLDDGEIERSINEMLSEQKPYRPYAFIYGHGLWNEVHPFESIAWVDQIQDKIKSMRSYYNATETYWPRIFITPNAPGEDKPDGYIVSQGNQAISKFEKFMRTHVPDRGLDFLGTYNMSVQASIPDGTHSGIRVNLLKAMSIINWLDLQNPDSLQEWQLSYSP